MQFVKDPDFYLYFTLTISGATVLIFALQSLYNKLEKRQVGKRRECP